MQYITQKELKEMMLFSFQRIEKEKEEINKINVFPVPDQDTGTNMAKTILGIKEAIEKKEFKDLSEISAAILDGALTAAQGNAGVIYTGFLAGFLPHLDKNPADSKKLAQAFEKGAERAKQSIQDPKEGTILDVINAATLVFKEKEGKETDIIEIFKVATERANEALLMTREKMEILKKANVVDAGGLGFLIILESCLEALEGKERKEKVQERVSEKTRKFIQVLANRYEIVALIKNPKLGLKEIQERLKRLGNSIDMVQVKNRMKIHIHTDYPDEVKEVLREIGKIDNLRMEDMAKEVVGEESIRKVSIGIVTEDTAMILPKISEKYQIELTYIKYDWSQEKELPGENIYQKLREADKRGIKSWPKFSQVPSQDYLKAFEKQLKIFEKVLSITVSSKLSGCYNSAIQGREMSESPEKIFIFDSQNAAAGQALLVLKAVELIQEQREIDEVLKELKKFSKKIRLYAILEDPKWLKSIGRISKGQSLWIKRFEKVSLHPVIRMKDGVLTKGGVVFAPDMAEALFKKVLKESKETRKKGGEIRAIINHGDNLEMAMKLKKILKERLKAEVSFVNLEPKTMSAAGPGTLVVAWAPI
jgi:DegV family protein with EDD domain